MRMAGHEPFASEYNQHLGELKIAHQMVLDQKLVVAKLEKIAGGCQYIR